jgi:hypothetical protein
MIKNELAIAYRKICDLRPYPNALRIHTRSQRRKAMFEWVMDWLADLFQNGTVKPGTALVFKGRKGTGKTKLAEWLVFILGAHGIILDKADQLTGRFNGHLAEKILVVADEATWGGEKSTVGALNTLITSRTLPIQRKGQDIIDQPSFHRLIIIGNSDWIVPATRDERRYVVLDVGEARRRDRQFFAALDRQMENGGAAAMMHELMNRMITRDVGHAPATLGLGHQIAQGLRPIDRLLVSIASEAVVQDNRGQHMLVIDPHRTTTIEKNRFMHVVRGQYHTYPAREVGQAMKSAGITERRPRANGARARMLDFPPLPQLIQNLEEAFGVPLNVLAGIGFEGDCENDP